MEKSNKKRTNYQRLYRNAKKSDVLSHNFAEEVVKMSKSFISRELKDEKLVEQYNQVIQIIRDKYNKLSV